MEVQIEYTGEKLARMEIRHFVNRGLKDVRDNALLDFDAAFDEIEGRYADGE